MIIQMGQFKTTLEVLKGIEEKKQNLSLKVIDGVLNIYARKNGAVLKVNLIKVEKEDNTELLTIEKEMLNKIEKQATDEFLLKINKTRLTTKINGINFSTALLANELEIDFKETEGDEQEVTVMMTGDIIANLHEAIKYSDLSGKREILKAINLKVKKDGIFVTATNSLRMFVYKQPGDFKKEVEVNMRPETITFLDAVFQATGKRPFPVILSNDKLSIRSKALYYSTPLILGSYPKVTEILERIKSRETKANIKFDKETIEKLKLIDNKEPFISIEKKGKEITFELKGEVSVNNFKIESEEEKDMFTKLSYPYLLDAVQTIPDMVVKEDAFLLETENVKILIMAVRTE